MKLRTQVTAVMVTVLVISVILNYLVFYLFTSHSFQQVEKDQAIKNMLRCRAIVENDLSYLTGLTKDWSHWDDMYTYVVQQNESFQRANLGITSFLNNQVSVCCIYDTEGRLVWGKAFDLPSEKELKAEDWILPRLEPGHPLVNRKDDADVVAGILPVSQGLLLVVSSAILTSTVEGPSHGTLLMGQIIDPDTIEAWSQRLNLRVRVWPLSGPRPPEDIKGELTALPDDTQFTLAPQNDNILHGYQVLDNLFNEPALLMQVELPREVNVAGQMLQKTALLSMALIGLILLLAGLILADRFVVAPLGQLTGNVLRARNSGVLAPSDLPAPSDELGQLCQAFELTLGEWREATQKAEALSQAKSGFLATVAHELRTPLSGIIGLAENLLQANPPPSSQHRLNTILTEAESLAHLINELLDSARIEAGRLKLEEMPFNLSAVLNEVMALLSVRAAQKKLAIQLETAPGVPLALAGDPHRLRQILINLAYNAVKFTEKGQVKITVAPLGESVEAVLLRFTVEDSGIGIPKDIQQLIFQKYVQAGADTARKYGGTGLGASIARDLVTLMGGQIGLQSEAGRGSLFWFEVSFRKSAGATASALPATESEPPYQPVRKAHILLAEDYAAVQYAVIHHLTSVGHTVEIASHGQEALDKLQTQTFDLVLMDVQMPVMDGFEATRQIRQRGLQMPILGMTAQLTEKICGQCLDAGMKDVLEKPIRRRRLLALVDQWLQGGLPVEPHSPGATTVLEEAPPIDWDQVMSEFDHNQALVLKLMSIYFENAREQITAIRYAVQTGNTKVLSFEAHKIKSGAGSLMMDPLSKAAARLEEIACAQPADQCAEAVHRVIYEFERVCAEASPAQEPAARARLDTAAS